MHTHGWVEEFHSKQHTTLVMLSHVAGINWYMVGHIVRLIDPKHSDCRKVEMVCVFGGGCAHQKIYSIASYLLWQQQPGCLSVLAPAQVHILQVASLSIAEQVPRPQVIHNLVPRLVEYNLTEPTQRQLHSDTRQGSTHARRVKN